jgi:hypothetical protein
LGLYWYQQRDSSPGERQYDETAHFDTSHNFQLSP